MRPRLAPLSVAWAMKIRSPQTTGEALPASGSGVFQRTFSFALHFKGGALSDEYPSPVGPRQLGQFSAWTDATKKNRAKRHAMRDIAGVSRDRISDIVCNH